MVSRLSPVIGLITPLHYQFATHTLQAAYREGGAEKATASVSDRLAHSVSIVGTVSECRSRIDQLLSEGADRLFVTLPAPTRAECEPILSGIIPARYQ